MVLVTLNPKANLQRAKRKGLVILLFQHFRNTYTTKKSVLRKGIMSLIFLQKGIIIPQKRGIFVPSPFTLQNECEKRSPRQWTEPATVCRKIVSGIKAYLQTIILSGCTLIKLILGKAHGHPTRDVWPFLLLFSRFWRSEAGGQSPSGGLKHIEVADQDKVLRWRTIRACSRRIGEKYAIDAVPEDKSPPEGGTTNISAYQTLRACASSGAAPGRRGSLRSSRKWKMQNLQQII